MNIRPLRSDEFFKIAKIYALSKLDELRFESGCFELLPIEQDECRIKELLESSIYVYEDLEVLGYGAFFKDQIRALYVHPDARGGGIGSDLLEFMISQVNVPARLFIAKSNQPARKLYERYGFKVTAEFQTSYNGVPVLANEMVQRINRE